MICIALQDMQTRQKIIPCLQPEITDTLISHGNFSLEFTSILSETSYCHKKKVWGWQKLVTVDQHVKTLCLVF